MHFSNGGGVYKATNVSSGENVIIKEGRPEAGLDSTGKMVLKGYQLNLKHCLNWQMLMKLLMFMNILKRGKMFI